MCYYLPFVNLRCYHLSMKKLLLLIGLCLLAYTCSKAEDNSPIAPIKYTVSVSASDGGSVSTSGGEYNENTSVSITANPQQGYEFSGWTGTTLTGSSISVKVISNQTITANFTRSIYTLTIGSIGSGEVTQQVINSARGEDYESGKTIKLTATPESQFLFYDWEQLNNNLSEYTYENPLEVIMDGSKTVTATFEEKLPIVNPDNSDKNTVGKWKIRKKRPGSQRTFSAKAVDCEVSEIIFRSDNSFTIITEASTITGLYTIESETSIILNQGETNIGRLTDIILTESFISFNIELTGLCDEQLDADKDPTYDEATDPTAPSNSGSQTSETGSSTLVSGPCKIETEIISENANQTVILGDPIQDIIIEVTVGSTCTETLSVSSSNLPEGVTVSLDNNQITIAGTPISNSNGTQVVFDYDIMLNVASPTSIISGTITVDNDTSTETNPNQGGVGTDNSGSANSSIASPTDDNCDIKTSINLQGSNGPNNQTINIGESIKDIEYFITSDCEQEIKISNVIGLPEGVLTSISISEDVLGIYGTPSKNVSGTYNYSITIDNHIEETNAATFISATVSEVISGSITVINTATTTSTSANSDQESQSFNIQVLLFENNSTDYRVLLDEDRLGGLNGDADPDLDFYVGDTINFDIDTPGHPFYLKTVQGTGTNDLISGVTNNGATNGTVSWTPTAAGTYYYQCSLHNGMYGTITVN